MSTLDGEKIQIIQAREDHLADIVALAESRSLGSMDPETARRDGFLVSGYPLEHYRDRLTAAEHFWVAVRGDQVVGFLLAYSDERLDPDEWLNHRIRATYGSFLVIKQVCVAPNAARQGVASQLYHHILERWPGSPVIAAVVSEPFNRASAEFHSKIGFEELTRLTPPDGRQRIVWVWRKPPEGMLQTQYQVAVDLYKHEDITNWQKLSNFFYVTAGLVAAEAFSISRGDGGISDRLTHGLGITIAVIGLTCSIAFSQMLYFGRRYLGARKSAVADLEHHMIWHGGYRIVGSPAPSRDRAWLQNSPTGLTMTLLPLAMAVCWLAILVVSLAA